MWNTKEVIVLAVCLFMSGQACADGIFGKIKDTTKKVTESVGDTITSTVDMASESDSPVEVRAEIDAMAAAALKQGTHENAEIRNLFDQSAGYAVFDARNITLGVAAGYGRGVAVSKTTEDRTYMRMGTGGVGWSFGVGGFATKVVILFETEADLISFVVNGYDGTAGAGSMIVDEKADQTVRFVDGRSIFVLSKQGLKVSASAVGTKYWADPKLNQ